MGVYQREAAHKTLEYKNAVRLKDTECNASPSALAASASPASAPGLRRRPGREEASPHVLLLLPQRVKSLPVKEALRSDHAPSLELPRDASRRLPSGRDILEDLQQQGGSRAPSLRLARGQASGSPRDEEISRLADSETPRLLATRDSNSASISALQTGSAGLPGDTSASRGSDLPLRGGAPAVVGLPEEPAPDAPRRTPSLPPPAGRGSPRPPAEAWAPPAGYQVMGKPRSHCFPRKSGCPTLPRLTLVLTLLILAASRVQGQPQFL